MPAVTVILRGGKKRRATTVSGVSFLWDSGATDIMIKIRRTQYYECKMRSNKVEYITADGVYCTTHYVKVPFYMPEFSSSKIINHFSHVKNGKEIRA